MGYFTMYKHCANHWSRCAKAVFDRTSVLFNNWSWYHTDISSHLHFHLLFLAGTWITINFHIFAFVNNFTGKYCLAFCSLQVYVHLQQRQGGSRQERNWWSTPRQNGDKTISSLIVTSLVVVYILSQHSSHHPHDHHCRPHRHPHHLTHHLPHHLPNHLAHQVQAIIIASYAEPVTAEQCAVVTEKLGDYLVSVGYWNETFFSSNQLDMELFTWLNLILVL